MDGHDSHVTLKAIEQIQKIGLNMATLLSHTSHALEPSNVSCFKPFKSMHPWLEANLANVSKLHLLDGWTKP